MTQPHPTGFLKTRFFPVLFGTIFSLVALESGLRFAGWVYLMSRHRGDSFPASNNSREKKGLTIVCLGDSYTYGLGVSTDESYPRQLDKMLHDKDIPGITIVNLGSPGGNSYRILNIFKENIKLYSPDIAIVMVGLNNLWNLEGLERFGFIAGNGRPLLFDFRSLRVYKLAKIISINLRSKISGLAVSRNLRDSSRDNDRTGSGNTGDGKQAPRIPEAEWSDYRKKMESCIKDGESGLMLEETNRMLERYPEDIRLGLEAVVLLREKGEYDSAIARAKKTLEQDISDVQLNSFLHRELMYLYSAEKIWGLARKEMDYAVRDAAVIQEVYPQLGVICNQESRLDFDKEIAQMRRLVKSLHGTKGTGILDTLIYLNKNAEENNKIFKNDLRELIEKAVKNRIMVVLMTYPVPVEFNGIIRQLAAEYKTGLIDNEAVFEALPDKKWLFNLDNHCNGKGYGVIAAHLYAFFSAENILGNRDR